MAEMDWIVQDQGGMLAHGRADDYLIIGDDYGVILTRWSHDADRVAAIRQAVVNTIRVYVGTTPEDEFRLRRLAQSYEDGQPVAGQPAWQHGYVPRG
jgi:hypothetical protein